MAGVPRRLFLLSDLEDLTDPMLVDLLGLKSLWDLEGLTDSMLVELVLGLKSVIHLGLLLEWLMAGKLAGMWADKQSKTNEENDSIIRWFFHVSILYLQMSTVQWGLSLDLLSVYSKEKRWELCSAVDLVYETAIQML